MKSQLRNIIGKLSLMTIPENALLDGVVKELRGRESFKDADSTNDERIYSADVFEQILGEHDEMGEPTMFKISDKVREQLEALSQVVISDYILVTLS